MYQRCKKQQQQQQQQLNTNNICTARPRKGAGRPKLRLPNDASATLQCPSHVAMSDHSGWPHQGRSHADRVSSRPLFIFTGVDDNRTLCIKAPQCAPLQRAAANTCCWRRSILVARKSWLHASLGCAPLWLLVILAPRNIWVTRCLVCAVLKNGCVGARRSLPRADMAARMLRCA